MVSSASKRAKMHALFVHFNWENFLRNFWEVCTFRLVRIFTPEDMFASGKEIGKGCGDVHSISDFLFDFEPHKVSHIRSRSSSLNWTIYSWEIISWKALKKKNFKITEKYAYLMITCAIKTNYDNLCDQNELSEDIAAPPQLLVCFDIQAEDWGPRVCDQGRYV